MIDNRPYVYAVYVDGIVRYIGKGRNGRVYDHVKAATKINVKRANGEKVKTTKFYNRLAKALRIGSKIETQVLVRFETDEEAFTEEIKQIAGRDGLWNDREGGNGHSTRSAKELMIKLRSDPEWVKWRAEAQSSRIKKQRTDPEFNRIQAEAASITCIRHWADPKFVERHKRRVKKLWEDDEFRKKNRQACNDGHRTLENRRKASIRVTQLFTDPNVIKNHLDGVRRREQDPDYVERRNKACVKNAIKFAIEHPEEKRALGVKAGRATMAKPENRKAASERAKRTAARPESKAAFAAMHRARMSDPITYQLTKDTLAAARNKNNADPEFQSRRIAAIKAYWAKRRENSDAR
jgi:hypothetical protein